MPHVDLLELPYFQGISIDELVALVDSMPPVEFREGDYIIRESENIPLFIVTRGQVAVEKKGPDNNLRTLAELSAPTVLGEIELFCELPAVSTVRAVSRVSAFIMERSTFNMLRESHNQAIGQFVFNVARVACHRLAVADQMLATRPTDENLPQMRENELAKMKEGQDLSNLTGCFRVTAPDPDWEDE